MNVIEAFFMTLSTFIFGFYITALILSSTIPVDYLIQDKSDDENETSFEDSGKKEVKQIKWGDYKLMTNFKNN